MHVCLLICLICRNDRQSEEYTTLLKEKDDQIAQLLDEGNKPSMCMLKNTLFNI